MPFIVRSTREKADASLDSALGAFDRAVEDLDQADELYAQEQQELNGQINDLFDQLADVNGSRARAQRVRDRIAELTA